MEGKAIKEGLGATALQSMAGLAAERAGVLLWVSGRAGGWLYSNRFWELFTGRSTEASLGNGWLQAIHPEDRGALLDVMAAAHSRRQSFSHDARVEKVDGSWSWFRFRGDPLEEEGLTGHAVDIQDLKAAQDEVEALAMQAQELVESAPTAIVLVDPCGEVRMVNARAEDLFGYTRFELDSMTLEQLIPSDDGGELKWRELVNSSAGGDSVRGVDIRGRRSNGDRFPAEVAVSRVGVADLSLLMVAVVDITERRRLEDNFYAAQKLESLGVLAGGVAHDFNNLLTTILGSAELAHRTLHSDHSGLQHLDRIRQAASHAADLCRQMLAYSGRGQFVVEPLRLSDLVESMVDLLSVSVRPGVDLETEIQAGQPRIRGDASQLRQIVMNLITNAAESVEERRGRVSISVRAEEISSDDLADFHLGEGVKPGLHVVLEVTDTGAGMDEETLERLFDPFFTTKPSGRGLGLAAVHGILRGHGGAIRVESQPGRGTSFQVLFPAIEAAPIPAESAKDADAMGSDRGLVLVVDDQSEVRGTAADMLRALGFQVVVARDGGDAMRRYADHKGCFRAILLDLYMPGMDVDELLERWGEERNEAPVIVMSGGDPQAESRVGREQGVVGYLPKPFSLTELETAIQAGRSD